MNAIGKQEWTIKNLLSILSNEKYCGDALLQKTFIQDCISKKVIPNTGQLPKYLIQNHHEGIVSRETFDAVQLEMARRNAKRAPQERAPPPVGASTAASMSSATYCSAGSAGRLPAVRVDPARSQAPRMAVCQPPGLRKKFCTQSPTLDEEPLQQAILAAVNAIMLDRDTLARQPHRRHGVGVGPGAG